MRISKPRREKLDRQGWLWEPQLRGHGHVRTVVGDYFEELTCQVFGGVRHVTGGTGAGAYSPDVVSGERYMEVKAVGRSGQAFIYAGRLKKDQLFATSHSLVYVFWHHGAVTTAEETVAGLRRALWAEVRWVAVVPFSSVLAICATRPEIPLNSKYGMSSGQAVYGSGYRFPITMLRDWIKIWGDDLRASAKGGLRSGGPIGGGCS